MNLSFVIPLSAAIVLFFISCLILRSFFKTRLITLLYLMVIPLAFGIWMINRTIAAYPQDLQSIDLFPISHLCYILAPMFLIYFIDLISKGHLTLRSNIFTFYGGALTVGAIFLDKYTVIYDSNSGWVQSTLETPEFYAFLYLNTLLTVIIFSRYLFIAYRKNKGESKQFLKKIIWLFVISFVGIFVFNGLRTMRLLDLPYINSIDTLFMALGFGTISWQYLKRPYLFHLDLLDVQLFGLFVFDNNGPLLYSYEFQKAGIKTEDKDLFVGALAGIDSLFKEVLASDQPLKEVRQESNIILLESGKGITIGLVTNLSTLMTRNWAYQFKVEFEKEFSEELLIYFSTRALEFEDRPDALIKRIFFHQ